MKHGMQKGGEMTEKPILFTAEMVRAILRDEKTQTRRVMKLGSEAKKAFDKTPPTRREGATTYELIDGENCWMCFGPYGKPGDHLWVRETWGVAPCFDNFKPSQIPLGSERHVDYRADLERFRGVHVAKWHPSIFMPRKFSRILLRVKDVRVERVQNISEGDARAEGCNSNDKLPTARAEFELLWNSINGKRGFGWDENPWVWVVEFERANSINS